MADPSHQVPLVKEGQFPLGECPPPYKESEMNGGYEDQMAYNNQQPGFAPRQPPGNQYPYNHQPPGVVPPQPQSYPAPSAPPVVNPVPSVANIVTAVNFAMPPSEIPLRSDATQMRCFYCQAFIKTKTTSSLKSSAHVACVLLFFYTCGLCCWLPYCTNSHRKIDHSCPACGSFLGSYNG